LYLCVFVYLCLTHSASNQMYAPLCMFISFLGLLQSLCEQSVCNAPEPLMLILCLRLYVHSHLLLHAQHVVSLDML